LRRDDALAALAGLTLAALAGCADAAPVVATATGSPSKPTAFGAQIYGADAISRSVDLIAGCGGKYVRAGAESGPALLDALFTAASARRVRVVLLAGLPVHPSDVASFAQSLAQLHARYASHNPVWEIWNEPNLAAFWGGPPDVFSYLRLLSACATALRAAGATDIWTGGTSGVDVNWIFNLRINGAFNHANGCAVHSYKAPGYARTEYIQAALLMPAGVQLHTTETCVASSVADQTSFFHQMWSVHRELNVPTMIWCELRDGSAGTSGPNSLPYGLVGQDYAPKSVYRVVQTTLAVSQ